MIKENRPHRDRNLRAERKLEELLSSVDDFIFCTYSKIVERMLVLRVINNKLLKGTDNEESRS